MGVLHLCFLFDVLVILYNRGNKAHKFLPCCRKRQDYKTKAFLFLFWKNFSVNQGLPIHSTIVQRALTRIAYALLLSLSIRL